MLSNRRTQPVYFDGDDNLKLFKKRLADLIWQAGGIQFGETVLTGGVVSPVYVNARVLFTQREIIRAIATQQHLIMENEAILYDRLCGMPTCGQLFVVALQSHYGTDTMPLPSLILQGDKDHGIRGKKVHGLYKADECVLLFDDILTTGGSILKTVAIFKEAGLYIADAMVLVDRRISPGPVGEVAIHSVFTLTELLDYYLEKGNITQARYAEVAMWRQSH